MKIHVEYEQTIHVERDFDVNKETIEYIKERNEIPDEILEQMIEDVNESYETESDYAITDDKGNVIIDWA